MFNILLAAILLTNAAVLAVILIALLKIRNKSHSIESSFKSFITQPDQDTPSPLAQTVDQASQLIARAIIVQAKTSLMGMSSVEARREKQAAVDEVTQKYPLVGLLKNLSPGISKSLFKNPMLLNLAGQLMSRGSANGQPQNSTPVPGNGKVKQPMFDL